MKLSKAQQSALDAAEDNRLHWAGDRYWKAKPFADNYAHLDSTITACIKRGWLIHDGLDEAKLPVVKITELGIQVLLEDAARRYKTK